MNKIKVGIVGFGMSAQVFHVPFLEANNHFKITKILERNTEKAKLLYPNIDVVKSLDQLVLDEQIDLIVVTTPNLSHYEIVKRALLNNKHVIVEKPFTVNVQQADELIEIAQKKKLVLSVYHNRRFDGGFLTLKKVIEDGLIGQVVEYEAHFDRFRNYIKDSWREVEEKGSGIVYDLGSHLIDQALYLFGLPKTVWADIRIQRENAKTADNFEIILGYEKLKVTLKASMLVREQSPHLAIHGTKGSYVKYGLDPQEELLKKGCKPIGENWGHECIDRWGVLNTQINNLHFVGKIETIAGSYGDYYQNIYDTIINHIELIVKPEQARNVIKVIELAYKSNLNNLDYII